MDSGDLAPMGATAEPPPHDLCACFHVALAHRGMSGRCRSLDSYGQPCTCPSFVHDTSDDDHPDDDWDEADPDGESAAEQHRQATRGGGEPP